MKKRFWFWTSFGQVLDKCPKRPIVQLSNTGLGLEGSLVKISIGFALDQLVSASRLWIFQIGIDFRTLDLIGISFRTWILDQYRLWIFGFDRYRYWVFGFDRYQLWVFRFDQFLSNIGWMIFFEYWMDSLLILVIVVNLNLH
ncbi:unnamed protein product [Rhizophagus irregularis]|nr:unnamed protein product [Rhizophagus irregularis]